MTDNIGELTSEHWELLDKTRFNDPKINRYARAVANGSVDGSPETHREYLGSRHWYEISRRMSDLTYGFSGFVGERFRPKNFRLAQEIGKYGRVEEKNVYTLNDFFWPRSNSIRIEGRSSYSSLEWSDLDNSWHVIVEQLDSSSDPEGSSTSVYVDIGSAKRLPIWNDPDGKLGQQATVIILNHWLLKYEEVPDPLGTSPSDLKYIASTEVPAEEMIERIRRKGEYDVARKKSTRYPLTNGWEKEIPETA